MTDALVINAALNFLSYTS